MFVKMCDDCGVILRDMISSGRYIKVYKEVEKTLYDHELHLCKICMLKLIEEIQGEHTKP